MSLSAFDGRALLLTLAIIVALVAVRRASRRLDREIPAVLDKPAPALSHVHARFRCRTCRRAVEVCTTPDAAILLMTQTTPPDCARCTYVLARLERQLAP